MGSRQAETLWVRCRVCRRQAIAPDLPGPRWDYRCPCGSSDYSLTVTDPSRPIRPAVHDSGPQRADIRLPDDPDVDVAGAIAAGRYP